MDADLYVVGLLDVGCLACADPIRGLIATSSSGLLTELACLRWKRRPAKRRVIRCHICNRSFRYLWIEKLLAVRRIGFRTKGCL